VGRTTVDDASATSVELRLATDPFYCEPSPDGESRDDWSLRLTNCAVAACFEAVQIRSIAHSPHTLAPLIAGLAEYGKRPDTM